MLTGLAVVLLVFIALLAVPVRLSYQISWRRAFHGSLSLQWLFGLVRIEFPTFEAKASAPDTKSLQRKKRARTPTQKKSNALAAVRQKSFRRRIMRFVRDFWRAIHKDDLKLRIRIGLGDPADTGRLWAVVGPVSGILATIHAASIEIEPEFFDTVFELDSSGNIRIVPLQMISLAIGLLLSPAIWQGLRQMREA